MEKKRTSNNPFQGNEIERHSRYSEEGKVLQIPSITEIPGPRTTRDNNPLPDQIFFHTPNKLTQHNRRHDQGML